MLAIENEIIVDSYTRFVDTSHQVQTLTAHSIVFSFATSATSPLTSTLSISGVTGNLTGIGVTCVDRLQRISSSSLLKIIRSADMVPSKY